MSDTRNPTTTNPSVSPPPSGPAADREEAVEAGGRRPPRATMDGSPLGAARSAFALLCEGRSPLCVDGHPYPGLPNRDLPLPELRTRLLARSCPRPTRDAVWRELVGRSRSEGAAWTVACVGVALPALSRIAGELCAAFAGDKSDVHAEILHGFLTGLATVDLDRPSVMNRLRWHAYRGGFAAVREALDAPTPFGPGFDSTPPPPLAGHPDFVLASAVTDGAISQADAEIIGTTRLEDVSLRDWATSRGLSYPAARQVRSRAERRLLAWLADDHQDDTDAERHRGTPADGDPDLQRSAPAGVSHIGPRRGVRGRRRTPSTTRQISQPIPRPTACPEEPRCA